MSIQVALEDVTGAGPQNAQSLAAAALGAELSFVASTGGTSEKVAISTANARSSVIASRIAMVTPDVDCFVRQGLATPTAVSDGTDQLLLAGNTYRLGVTPGNKLAFITATGTGFVYITPGA
jgi:hypothetical protein